MTENAQDPNVSAIIATSLPPLSPISENSETVFNHSTRSPSNSDSELLECETIITNQLAGTEQNRLK